MKSIEKSSYNKTKSITWPQQLISIKMIGTN